MNKLRQLVGATLGAATIALSGAAYAQADNTNSKTDPTFSQWMNSYSTSNQGRISRDAYMKEQQRRWDMMDKQNRGLTTQEINGMYGYGSMNQGPAGTVTTPGYMGPKDVKK